VLANRLLASRIRHKSKEVYQKKTGKAGRELRSRRMRESILHYGIMNTKQAVSLPVHEAEATDIFIDKNG